MSHTNFRNDSCFLNQTNKSNKSILDYTLDTTPFVNKNECSDFTPTFLSYIPSGIKKMDVDLENELRGTVRPNTKCASCKFNPQDGHIHTDVGNKVEDLKKQPINKDHIKPECKPEFKILPNGYYGYF